jgi:predicted ATPase
VTLLFTDIEGSTSLLDRLGREYAGLLAQHHIIVRAAISAHDGYEVGTAGDSFFVTFARPDDAVACAQQVQEQLAAQTWPGEVQVDVRIGIHTGTPEFDGTDYTGMDVHRAARIMAAAHGRQVLMSGATAQLVPGLTTRDLGDHRLKDLPAPERLLQLGSAEFPPPRGIGAMRLPAPPSALVGRETEVTECVTALREGARLLTLTGPGGVGKTRLALAVAAAAGPHFGDGVTFVDLAPVQHADGVVGAITAALGGSAGASLDEQLQARHMLLVLDNLEHLPDATPVVRGILDGARRVSVLATSRGRLRLSGENVRPVEPLRRAAARELLATRIRDVGTDVDQDDESVDEICALLDDLPLALELAAARSRTLGVQGVAERLERRLDLLTLGPRDVPERQRTLRATIDWSFRLLQPQEQDVFSALAVFLGCDISDAEAVCGVPALDAVEVLLDAGLLRRLDQPGGRPRLVMLETLREYALEQLEHADSARAAKDGHAVHFLARAREIDLHINTLGRPEVRAAVRRDIDNFRAAHDHLLEVDPDSALELVSRLWPYWIAFGPISEGRHRVSASLEGSSLAGNVRGRALLGAGMMALYQGDTDEAEPLLSSAEQVFRVTGDARSLAVTVSHRGQCARVLGKSGRPFDEEALRIARESGDDWSLAMAMNNLAASASREEPEMARAMLEESLEPRRRSGDLRGELITEMNLSSLASSLGDVTGADAHSANALTRARALQDNALLASALAQRAMLHAMRDDKATAVAALDESLVLHAEVDEAGTAAQLLLAAAAVLAEEEPRLALRCWGGAGTLDPYMGGDAEGDADWRWFRQVVSATLGDQAIAEEMSRGEAQAWQPLLETAVRACDRWR